MLRDTSWGSTLPFWSLPPYLLLFGSLLRSLGVSIISDFLGVMGLRKLLPKALSPRSRTASLSVCRAAVGMVHDRTRRLMQW